MIMKFLFLVFPTIFLCIAFLVFLFAVFAIIRQIRCFLTSRFAAFSFIRWIRFARWWVWRWWVWIRVCWYVHFSFLLWRFRWVCSWRGFRHFFSIGIKSNCDVVPLVLFVPTGFMVDSLKYIGVQSPDFRSKFENQFYSYSLFLTMSRSLRPLFIFQKHDMVQTTRIHTSTFWFQ